MREAPHRWSARAQRRRNDLKEQFGRHADGGPEPHHRIRHRREHGQRHRPSGIFALPLAHRDEHENAPYPRAGDDKHEPDVEPGARRQRRIEREEHRGLAHENRDQRHAPRRRAPSRRRPTPRASREAAVERGHRDEIAEAHDEEDGQHIGHRDAVRRHRHEILSRRADVGAQRAAHPHLPGAEERGGQKRRERHPEMRKAKPFNVAHRKPSRPDPA